MKDWLALPEQTCFGFASIANDNLCDRVRTLSDQTSRALSTARIMVVVADQTEARLLRADIARASPRASNTRICHYGELVRRSHVLVWDWTWEAAAHTVFLCHADIYYSAAFALFMIRLMAWANSPTSPSRIHVLTLSESLLPSSTLLDTMPFICPRIVRLYNVALPSLSAQVGDCDTLVWNNDSFVNAAVELLSSYLGNDSTVIVYCSARNAGDIEDCLTVAELPYRALYNTVSAVDDLIAVNDQAGASTPGLVVFLMERSRIYGQLGDLTAVLVSDSKDTAVFQKGMTMFVDTEVAQIEIDLMKSYIDQYYAAHVVQFIIPQDPSGRRRRPMPRRRVGNKQIWGFMAALRVYFPQLEPDCSYVAAFIQRRMSYECAMKQLRDMGFPAIFDRRADTSSQSYLRYHLELGHFLPLLDYRFHVALFITVGLNLPGTSDNAKRAMVGMASLIHHELRLLGPREMSICLSSETSFEIAMGRLAGYVAPQFSMPQRRYMHGVPWVSLAALYAAPRGFSNARLDILGDGIFVMETSAYQKVRDTMTEIAVGAGHQWLAGDEPLILTDDDVASIDNAIFEAWMHRLVIVENPDDSSGTSFTALVARRCGVPSKGRGDKIRQGIHDVLPLDIVFEAQKNEEFKHKDRILMATLEVQIVAGSMVLRDCVILHEDSVSRWLDVHDQRLPELASLGIQY